MQTSMSLKPEKRKRRERSDFGKLIKTGIVQFNVICAFVGMYLALYLKGESIFSHLILLVSVLLGSALVVAGSCVLNNYIDKDIDKIMKRTQSRPSVTGKYNDTFILTLGTCFVIAGHALLFFTSLAAFVYAFIGFFGYVVVYSLWAKRKTSLNTIIGAIPGAIPIFIGYASVDPKLGNLVWGVFLVMFVWQMPHFYAIAIRRCDEYKEANVPMLPVVRGFKWTKVEMIVWVILLCVVTFFMKDLGMIFVSIMTVFNITWLILSFLNKKFDSEKKWATVMFFYSIFYFMILFGFMIISTFF